MNVKRLESAHLSKHVIIRLEVTFVMKMSASTKEVAEKTPIVTTLLGLMLATAW